jgi:gluconokinase
VTLLVVMGVLGCGKSRVGALVGERLVLPIIDGEAFHFEKNRALMRSGIALTDADRADWLDRLGRA